MNALEIPQEILSEMVLQARGEAPVEACGVLAGRENRVQKLYKVRNSDQSTEHFMMAPEEQFAVVKEIRSKELEMLAIYHSHPATEARPSAEDVCLALTPDVLYVIVSLQGPGKPQVRGFTIEDGLVSESAIRIVEKN